MKAIVAVGAIAILAIPAAAQQMDHSKMPGMSMPGMKMPAKKKPAAKPAVRKPAAQTAVRKPTARRGTPAATRAKAKPVSSPGARPSPPATSQAPAVDPMAGHDMSTMEGMEMHHGGAQPSMDHSNMPGMATSGTPAPAAAMDHSNMPGMAAPGTPAPAAPMDHSNMPGMQMPANGAPMTETRPGHTATGTALAAGNAPAPAAPTDSYADRIYSPAAMAAARQDLRDEHGGAKIAMVLFNLAEYQVRKGRDGFRLDGSAWYGGDINRVVLKTEAEGNFGGEGVESAEVQALYSRAVGPYTDIQIGARYDFKPNPSRVYATAGFETLAPGFFDVEGALFLSDKGDLLGRFEGYYDQRITQRLILQPEAEINFALQDVRENGIGSGVSDVELGLRLRYEIKREFAPYVGVSYERKFGDTARFARANGDGAGSTSLVLGVRTWF